MDAPTLAAVAGISIGGNGLLGILIWGFRGELKALKADMGTALAEQELRIIRGINGTYVRPAVCNAHHEAIGATLRGIEAQVTRLEKQIDG